VSRGGGEETTLSLAEAVNLALANNPLLKGAEHALEGAKAKVGQARSGFLPSVDVYEDYSRTTNPMMAVGSKLNQESFSTQDYALSRLNEPPPVSNFNTRFVVTQPLFDQGKTFVELNQARLGREAAEHGMERVKQEIIFEVIKLYSQLIMAREDLQLAQETEKVSVAHVKLAEDLFQTGQVVKSDLLSAKVRLSEVREMVIQAHNGLILSRAALNRAMGIDQNELIEVSKELPYEPEHPEVTTTIPEALENRPDYLALDRAVVSAQEGIKLAKTDYLPSLNFVAHYDLNDKNEVWNSSGESWTIGGIVHLNVFDGLKSTYRVREATHTARQYESRKEELKSQIELEVRAAVTQLNDAEERVKVAREAIGEAEESLRIVEDRYKVGLSTMVEVLDNEVAVTRTKRNHLRAIHDRRVAQASVDLARGTISPQK
jgi:outer membrane protein TolC